MRAINWAILASLLLLVAFTSGPLRAADKAKDLIVGKWEPTKLPQGAKNVVIEFTKDGKVLLTGTANEKEIKFEGKYKFVDDDTMETTFNRGGKEQTKKTKIIKIGKDELVTKDEGDKDEESFKRVK